MIEPAHKLATFEDLLAQPEGRRCEVLAGTLVEKAAPLPEHGLAQRALGRFVGGPFDDDDGRGGPGGWWILSEVEVELEAHEVVRPDLVGWRREQLPSPWGQRPIRVVPGWICEILSPTNERQDRVHKADVYARAGVPSYWMLQPSERLLEAFELHESKWVRLGAWSDGEVVRIPPFDAVELETSRLFPPAS